jgi:hypothetical protein
MTEGRSSGQENASLYARGVTEGFSGKPLDGKILLEILDVFSEDSLRAYILGHTEGSGDAEEEDDEEEEI